MLRLSTATIEQTLIVYCIHCSDPAVYRKTTWHCDPDAEQHDSQYGHENPQQAPSVSNKDGLQLVANAARRVWEELYIHKKPVSEIKRHLKLLKELNLTNVRNLTFIFSDNRRCVQGGNRNR